MFGSLFPRILKANQKDPKIVCFFSSLANVYPQKKNRQGPWAICFVEGSFGLGMLVHLDLFKGDFLFSAMVNHHEKPPIWDSICFSFFQASSARFAFLGGNFEPTIFDTSLFVGR